MRQMGEVLIAGLALLVAVGCAAPHGWRSQLEGAGIRFIAAVAAYHMSFRRILVMHGGEKEWAAEGFPFE